MYVDNLLSYTPFITTDTEHKTSSHSLERIYRPRKMSKEADFPKDRMAEIEEGVTRHTAQPATGIVTHPINF